MAVETVDSSDNVTAANLETNLEEWTAAQKDERLDDLLAAKWAALMVASTAVLWVVSTVVPTDSLKVEKKDE